MVVPANPGAMFFIARVAAGGIRETFGTSSENACRSGPKAAGWFNNIHTMFGVLGISFDDFTPVYLSFEDGGKALEAGDVDAQWQCPYPNVVMREISERMDVCVLEYDTAPRRY